VIILKYSASHLWRKTWLWPLKSSLFCSGFPLPAIGLLCHPLPWVSWTSS
jgi:hypothetical protein